MDAHDVEFRFGINDRQVCTALTLHVPSTLLALRHAACPDLAILTA